MQPDLWNREIAGSVVFGHSHFFGFTYTPKGAITMMSQRFASHTDLGTCWRFFCPEASSWRLKHEWISSWNRVLFSFFFLRCPIFSLRNRFFQFSLKFCPRFGETILFWGDRKKHLQISLQKIGSSTRKWRYCAQRGVSSCSSMDSSGSWEDCCLG